MNTFKWLILFGIALVVFDKVVVFSNVEAYPIVASVYNWIMSAVECVYFVFIFLARTKKWI